MGAQANIVDSVHIFIAIAAHKGLAAYALGSSIVDSQVGAARLFRNTQRGLQQRARSGLLSSPGRLHVGHGPCRCATEGCCSAACISQAAACGVQIPSASRRRTRCMPITRFRNIDGQGACDAQRTAKRPMGGASDLRRRP